MKKILLIISILVFLTGCEALKERLNTGVL